jgi:hypothetical protein
MSYRSIKRFSVIGALSVTALLGIYAGSLFYLRAEEPGDDLFELHSLLVTILVATWVVADAQEHRRALCSFDHGSFVFIAFPFYVPYYLISTRRWRRGLLMVGGVVLLFMVPWLAELFVWLIEVFVWITHTLTRYAQLLISYVR